MTSPHWPMIRARGLWLAERVTATAGRTIRRIVHPGEGRHTIGATVCGLVAVVLLAPAPAASLGVADESKISDTQGGFSGVLEDRDYFSTVARLGDLDGNGVDDLAVGAQGDDDGGPGRGAVWILFLSDDGSVVSHVKISSTSGGFTGELSNYDYFGAAVAGLGDLDGDGVLDLAVGAMGDDDGGGDGAVWILFLRTDGFVKAHQKISRTQGGLTGAFDSYDDFGSSLAALGDVDGDGVTELGVGAPDFGTSPQGGAFVLFLRTDGTVKGHVLIAPGVGGFPNEPYVSAFGSAIAPLGDLNGDGTLDLAVGARDDREVASGAGAVYVFLLASDLSVLTLQKITTGLGGFEEELGGYNGFGDSLAFLGDFDGDGFDDLAVGASGHGEAGAVWLLSLDPDGSVRSEQQIDGAHGGFSGELARYDSFGRAMGPLGDFDGDSIPDLAVGALGDDDGGSSRGAVWLLFLDPTPPACGDGILDSQEECDDGGTTPGDHCAATCEVEDFVALAGTALGGSVSVTLDGAAVSIGTSVGQSATDVAVALVAAVNSDPALAGLGVTAVSEDEFLITNASVDSVSISDPGLAEAAPAFELFGSTQGGSVSVTVNGVVVTVTTDSWDPRNKVAEALALAITVHPTLSGQGVVAFADVNLGSGVITNGTVTDVSITDPGLTIVAQITPGTTVRKIVLQGDVAPGTGGAVFDGLQSLVANDSGEIAVWSRLVGGAVAQGIFRFTDADGLEPFVLPGELAVGTGGSTYSGFRSFALNEAGELAYRATLVGAPPTIGVFARGPEGDRVVAFKGDPAPGTGGGTFSDLFPFGIDDAGSVFFTAYVSGGTGLSGSFRAAGGVVTPLVLMGDVAPGTGGLTFWALAANSINGLGEIAFSVYLSDGSEAIFVLSGGTLALVAMDGDTAPGTGGATFDAQYVSGTCAPPGFGAPVINDAGEVAFFAPLSNGDVGLFLEDAAGLGAVALSGDPAPGSNGAVFQFGETPGIALGDDGHVAFVADLLGGFGGAGLFRSRVGAPRMLVRDDDVAPGSEGGAFVFLTYTRDLAINANGERSAFDARTTPPYNTPGVWRMVACSVTVGPGSVDFDGDGICDADDNCPTVVNSGQTDDDVDTVGDACDNCLGLSNPPFAGLLLGNMTLVSGQRDDDGDGVGNRCDFKYDGNVGTLISGIDVSDIRNSVFTGIALSTCGATGTKNCAQFDHDEVGTLVGPGDVSALRARMFTTNGPSGTAPPFGGAIGSGSEIVGWAVCSGPAC